MIKIRWLCGVFLLWLAVLPAVAQSDVAVYSTAQRFNGGVMIWRSDSGFIWVLADDGRVIEFPLSAYAAFPDNPIRAARGQSILPQFGFGKVWGSMETVRELIGWPTQPELGFNMGIHEEDGVIYLTQSNGVIYQVNPDDTWEYAQALPAAAAPLILRFQVTPQTAAPGTTLMLDWQIQGAELALVEIYDATNEARIELLADQPPSGSTSFNVPYGTLSTALQFTIYAANKVERPGSDPYQRLAQERVTVEVLLPVVTQSNPGATFQEFERGFMIWRADTREIYVFRDAGELSAGGGGPYFIFPLDEYRLLSPNAPPGAPSSGLIAPERGFGQVWGSFRHVRDALGWATLTEAGYLAAAQLENDALLSITIPSGRTVYLNPVESWWGWEPQTIRR